VDRLSREPIRIANPAATVVLAFQPSVLRTLQNRDSFRGQGIFGRFLWLMPRSLIGDRLTGTNLPALDRAAESAYETAIDSLLRLGPAAEDPATGAWTPRDINLEPDALEAWSDFDAEAEALLRDDGELGSMRDWGAKLVGNVVRVAGLFHLVSVADEPDPFAVPIPAAQMERAAELARSVLIPHARAAYGSMERDGTVALANYLWKRIGGEDRTKRDIFDISRGRADVQTVTDIEPALDLLVQHGLVRLDRVQTRGRPSDVVRVNPWAT
jgi:hypothetical protein